MDTIYIYSDPELSPQLYMLVLYCTAAKCDCRNRVLGKMSFKKMKVLSSSFYLCVGPNLYTVVVGFQTEQFIMACQT